MKPAIHVIAAFLIANLAATTVNARETHLDHSERYSQCLDDANDHPEAAYERASVWVDRGGGLPARHCLALAMVGIGQFAEAATQFKDLANLNLDMPKATRAELWVQSGEASLLAKNASSALKAFGEAAKLSPEDAGILVDKARACAMQPDWTAAAAALDQALRVDPNSIDAWALRATARRELGKLSLAEEDIETALALDEKRGDIWLERGRLDQAKGDKKAARRHLLQAITLDDKSLIAEQARYALEAMDLKH